MTEAALQAALAAPDDAPEGPPGLETVNAVAMLHTPPPARQYLLDGLPLGVVGLIVGHGGISKSTLVLDMALSVCSGRAVCGGLYAVQTPGEVLIAAGEDDVDELHRRIHALGQTKFGAQDDWNTYTEKVGARLTLVPLCGKPAVLCNETGAPTPLFEDLLACAKERPNLRLIVVDPLRRFYDGEENDSHAAMKLVVLLEQLVQETGATVLAVHHMSKASARGQPYAARGSSAFTDGVRWQLNLSQLTEKRAADLGISAQDAHRHVELLVTKNNYAPSQGRSSLLKRVDHGVLAYVDLDQQAASALSALVEQVVQRVAELDAKGEAPAKNAFIQANKGKAGPFGVTEGQLRDAVDQAIKEHLLQLVADPTHIGKGKTPLLLKPV